MDKCFLLTFEQPVLQEASYERALKRFLNKLPTHFKLRFDLLDDDCVKITVAEDHAEILKKRLIEKELTHGLLVETVANSNRLQAVRPSAKANAPQDNVVRVPFGRRTP